MDSEMDDVEMSSTAEYTLSQACRFKAERDAAVQELQGLRERNIELWMESGMANELVTCAEDKAERLGKLVWRLQNRLARAHRREKAIRKGMREWREKAIGGPVRTMSAYDLLPEEDLRALRWVREHGGIEKVRRDFRDAYNRRTELCAALGIDLDTGWSDAMAELDRRLMPEGMEWMLWDDGKPVTYDDAPDDVIGVYLALDGSGYVLMTDLPDQLMSEPSERVKRPEEVPAADGKPLREGEHVYHVETGAELVVKELPKPGEYQAVVVFALPTSPASHLTSFDPDQLTHERPVLDADGNRIEPAMDVWWVCEGDERGTHAEKLHVEGIDEDGMVECSPYNGGTWVYLDPSELHVKKPVLDADGVPIREGDTVWHIKTGRKYVVVESSYGETIVVRLAKYDDAEGEQYAPDDLTHAKPEQDSWDSVWMDVSNGCETPHGMERRCKALAEKED